MATKVIQEVEKVSQVDQTLEKMENISEHHIRLIEALSAKLTKVLTPEAPYEPKNEPAPNLVALAERMMQVARRETLVSDFLESILARLEL